MPSHVQSVGNRVFGTLTITGAFGSDTLAGSAVGGAVWWSNITSVLQSVTVQGNTAILLGNPTASATKSAAGFYYEGVTAAACSIIATFDVAPGESRIAGHEVGSGGGIVRFDTFAGQNQNAPGTGVDAVTSGAITPAVNNEYLMGVAFSASGVNCTPGTGFTQVLDSTTRESEYLIQGAAASQAGTFTAASGDAWITWVLAFSEGTPITGLRPAICL